MSEYKIEVEIFEGKGGQLHKEGDQVIFPDLIKEGICAWMYWGDGEKSYQAGQRFAYPDDAGKMCPWLVVSLDEMAKTLMFGGTLPWRYKDTPYEKVIDSEGVTTEFVRCVDPTASGIVVKLIRTKVD